MRPVRVLALAYAVSDRRHGGEVIGAYELLKALAEEGVDVDLVTPALDVETPLPSRVRAHVVKRDVRWGHTGLHKARIVREARRLASRERFDVVHSLNQWTSWPIFARPFVVSGCFRPHGGVERGVVKRKSPVRALLEAPASEWGSRSFELARSAWEERVRGRGLEATLRGADHRIVRQGAGVEPYSRYGPTTFIPFGVDTERFTPDPSIAKEPVIAYAAHFLPFKRPLHLVEAAAILAREGLPFRVAMAGSGPLEADARERAKALGVADRIDFLGHLPRSELANVLRKAAVFCLPSMDEPGGLASLEAMACGTPVVCSRTIVAALDYVEDGVNGALVDPDPPAALAAGLRPFLADPAFARRAGAAARATAERFSWRELARRHVALYQSL